MNNKTSKKLLWLFSHWTHSVAEANPKLEPENLHLNSKCSVTVVKLTNGLLAAPRTSDPRLPGNMSVFTAAGRPTPLLFDARAKKFSGLANIIGEITWQTKHQQAYTLC